MRAKEDSARGTGMRNKFIKRFWFGMLPFSRLKKAIWFIYKRYIFFSEIVKNWKNDTSLQNKISKKSWKTEVCFSYYSFHAEAFKYEINWDGKNYAFQKKKNSVYVSSLRRLLPWFGEWVDLSHQLSLQVLVARRFVLQHLRARPLAVDPCLSFWTKVLFFAELWFDGFRKINVIVCIFYHSMFLNDFIEKAKILFLSPSSLHCFSSDEILLVFNHDCRRLQSEIWKINHN